MTPGRRLATAMKISAAALVATVSLAVPASADIITPATGAVVILPTTVRGTGTAGLEIYVAAVSQQAGREVTHCSTVVTPDGTYACDIPSVSPTGQFQFVVHQFPPGQSPTPINTFEQVAVTVVASLPATPADLPTPLVIAGLVLVVAGLGLVSHARQQPRRPDRNTSTAMRDTPRI